MDFGGCGGIGTEFVDADVADGVVSGAGGLGIGTGTVGMIWLTFLDPAPVIGVEESDDPNPP